MQNVFGMLPREKLEVVVYALTGEEGDGGRGPWRQRIRETVDHFEDISALPLGEAARRIHQDEVHILVNLDGYTKGNRNEIFALRPAPIQISFMGFCGSSSRMT